MLNSYWQTMRLFSRNTRLYLIVSSLTTLSYTGIYVMLFNLYLLRLGHGPEFIGLINAAAQLGVAAFSIPAGMLGRRWGSRRLIIAGLVTATVGLALVPLVEFIPAPWQTRWILVTYIFAWLGGGTYLVNSLPFLMSATGDEERSHVFSMREALVPLALFVGSLLGGLLPGMLAASFAWTLADPAPYRFSLFIAAGLFGLAPITMLATQESQTVETPKLRAQPGTSPALAPWGLMALMGAVILLLSASKHITDTFFNVYLDLGLQLSPLWIGTLAAVTQLLAVPIALLAPLVLARWGKGQTILAGTLGMALSLWVILIVPNWLGAGIGLLGISALFAVTIPAFTIVNQEAVIPEWRATMSGVIAMSTGLSRSGTALGGGYLITSLGFSGLFMVGAGLTIAGALLFGGYIWWQQRRLLYRTEWEMTR